MRLKPINTPIRLLRQKISRLSAMRIALLLAVLAVGFGGGFYALQRQAPTATSAVINQTSNEAPKAAKPLTIADFTDVIAKSKQSVVRVEAEGCGFIYDSTGFVVAPQLVATTAHSVAGIQQIRVKADSAYYDATVVKFNPNIDFALLRVNELSLQPIPLEKPSTGLAMMNENTHSQAVILGYPNGGAFAPALTTITEEYSAIGYDIYQQPSTRRNIFDLAAKVVPGSSGSPVINQKGNILGILYGYDRDDLDTSFALPLHTQLSTIEEAEQMHTAVSTQSCLQ